MKITRNQLRRIIKEEKARLLKEDKYADAVGSSFSGDRPGKGNDDHLYPRVMWTNVEELTDKWISAEYDSFDEGDPSMMAMGDSATEARIRWNDQIEGAAMDMEAEMTARIRKVALQTMKEFSQKLIEGDYA